MRWFYDTFFEKLQKSKFKNLTDFKNLRGLVLVTPICTPYGLLQPLPSYCCKPALMASLSRSQCNHTSAAAP